jgi:hypothetical protein
MIVLYMNNYVLEDSRGREVDKRGPETSPFRFRAYKGRRLAEGFICRRHRHK